MPREIEVKRWSKTTQKRHDPHHGGHGQPRGNQRLRITRRDFDWAFH